MLQKSRALETHFLRIHINTYLTMHVDKSKDGFFLVVRQFDTKPLTMSKSLVVHRGRRCQIEMYILKLHFQIALSLHLLGRRSNELDNKLLTLYCSIQSIKLEQWNQIKQKQTNVWLWNQVNNYSKKRSLYTHTSCCVTVFAQPNI